MKDTIKVIDVINLITKKDTLTISVNENIVNSLSKEQSVDTFQVLAIILPIVATLLTLFLTRLFDNISESKKYKRDILKQNRSHRISIWKSLEELRTSLYKTNFPDAEIYDFYIWTADRMISVNPFYDLKINSNILFDRDIIDLSNSLYNSADTISQDFDWQLKEQPSSNINLGKEILENLDKIINKISQNIKDE